MPQALCSFPGLSPWACAPACVVHDWLFEAHHCGYAPDNPYSFDDSITVMSEGLKAIMQSNPRTRNLSVFDAAVGAVGSPLARGLGTRASASPLRSMPGHSKKASRQEYCFTASSSHSAPLSPPRNA